MRRAALEVPTKARVRPAAELAHEILRLAEGRRGLLESWDLHRVSLNLVLGGDARLLRLRALRGAGLGAAEADVLVVADCFLREPAKDFVLLMTHAVNPVLHVI